jgi:hypothetical protein
MPKGILLAGALCLTASTGYAQSIDLAGVDKFTLVIEDPEGVCGINKTLVQDVFESTAKGARFQITDAAHATLVIDVTTVQSPNACASSISVQVRELGWVEFKTPPEKSERPFYGTVLRWDEARITMSDPDDHPRAVSRAVGELAVKFITDWNFRDTPTAKADKKP